MQDAPLLPSYFAALSAGPERPFRLVARLLRLGAAEAIGDEAGFPLLLLDQEGEEFATAPLCGPRLAAPARRALLDGRRVLLAGRFTEVRRRFALSVEDLQPLAAATPLLCPAPEEIAAADAVLDGAEDLEALLLGGVHRLLGVRERSLSPRFLLAERAVIYAALCTGQVDGRTNPRLSLFFVSKPATGKKLLAEASRILQPVHHLVQIGMATPAGLNASVSQSPRQGFLARPGLIALADQGAVAIEDLHRLDSAHLQAIWDTLCATLEDGRLLGSKSGRACYRAHTSIQISVNRKSELRGRCPGASFAERLSDLSLTLDLLSRIEVLCDLDAGDDAEGAAAAMLAAPGPAETPLSEDERGRLERRLRLIAARLRDRLPEVDLAQVAAPMQARLAEAALVLKEALCELCDQEGAALKVDSLLRRLSQAIRKAVAAEARLRRRAAALPADVERAWEVLQLKVRAVLGLLAPAGEPGAPWQELCARAATARAERARRVEAIAGGREVGIEDLLREPGLLCEAELGLRQYLRDLPEEARLPGGRFRIPLSRASADAAGMPAATYLLGPPGSPQVATDVAAAERLFAHTPTWCVVLPRAARAQAGGEWVVERSAGAALVAILDPEGPFSPPAQGGVLCLDPAAPRDLRLAVGEFARRAADPGFRWRLAILAEDPRATREAVLGYL